MTADFRDFRRAVRAAVGKPVAYHMHDGLGAVAAGVVERVARGERVHDAELSDLFARGPQSTYLLPGKRGDKAMAVVGMYGIALYDVELPPICFSTLRLSQTINALAADPAVGTILLDIASPGGAVTGTKEAADAVFSARSKKPVIALVNPLCCSAAYWIGSQASEIWAVPSGDQGSIGVYHAHTDCSKAMDAAGIKTTFIHAGEHKVEASPYSPLSEEARVYRQAEVDAIHEDFLRGVARGRGTTVSNVRANFGKGRTMAAGPAKAAGLIDRNVTIDEAVRMAGTQSAFRAAQLARFKDAPAEADRVQQAEARRSRLEVIKRRG
jgi:signal peptide peptidase SppA